MNLKSQPRKFEDDVTKRQKNRNKDLFIGVQKEKQGARATKAVRRRHCVGAGAPVNFGRQAVARRRSQKIGLSGGAALTEKNVFSKIPEKISFYPQNFLKTENCNKISTQQQWHRWRADKLSAAAHGSICHMNFGHI